MPDVTFYDAAFPPPAGAEPATDGVCIYLGGDTPHIWLTVEVARQPARYRLPIWVRSDPAQADANADAQAAIARLRVLGAPRGALVALDVETAVDPAYTRNFSRVLLGAGYPVIVYGSRLDVFGNQAPEGLYFAADWTGTPHLASGSQMTQYVSFRNYDLSVALPTLPFWDTRPPAVPAPAPAWQEAMMHALPVIRPRDTGADVRTVQGLVCARLDISIKIDGVYGPVTGTSIVQLQRLAKIAEDGVVGPVTWPVLMHVA